MSEITAPMVLNSPAVDRALVGGGVGDDPVEIGHEEVVRGQPRDEEAQVERQRADHRGEQGADWQEGGRSEGEADEEHVAARAEPGVYQGPGDAADGLHGQQDRDGDGARQAEGHGGKTDIETDWPW